MTNKLSLAMNSLTMLSLLNWVAIRKSLPAGDLSKFDKFKKELDRVMESGEMAFSSLQEETRFFDEATLLISKVLR